MTEVSHGPSDASNDNSRAGTDRVLGRTVAIKVLAPQFSKDQRLVERFRREAKAAAALQHRNVVSVFDTGSTSVSPPVRGRETHGQLRVFGTAAYVSPEQALGRPVDPRSDVYSLGCVLYEMLTGSAPFTGAGPVAVAYKHVHEEPVRPSELNPEVPPAVESVVMRALEEDPGARYRDAGEMARALEGLGLEEAAVPLVLGEPTAETAPVEAGESDTAPIAPVEEGPRRKVPVAWLAAALAILAAATLLPVFLIGGEPTSSVPDTAEAAERVRVPDVRGFTKDDAIRRLSRVGFTTIALGEPLGDEVQATVGAESPSPSPADEEEPEEEEPPPERPSPKQRPESDSALFSLAQPRCFPAR